MLAPFATFAKKILLTFSKTDKTFASLNNALSKLRHTFGVAATTQDSLRTNGEIIPAVCLTEIYFVAFALLHTVGRTLRSTLTTHFRAAVLTPSHTIARLSVLPVVDLDNPYVMVAVGLTGTFLLVGIAGGVALPVIAVAANVPGNLFGLRVTYELLLHAAPYVPVFLKIGTASAVATVFGVACTQPKTKSADEQAAEAAAKASLEAFNKFTKAHGEYLVSTQEHIAAAEKALTNEHNLFCMFIAFFAVIVWVYSWHSRHALLAFSLTLVAVSATIYPLSARALKILTAQLGQGPSVPTNLTPEDFAKANATQDKGIQALNYTLETVHAQCVRTLVLTLVIACAVGFVLVFAAYFDANETRIPYWQGTPLAFFPIFVSDIGGNNLVVQTLIFIFFILLLYAFRTQLKTLSVNKLETAELNVFFTKLSTRLATLPVVAAVEAASPAVKAILPAIEEDINQGLYKKAAIGVMLGSFLIWITGGVGVPLIVFGAHQQQFIGWGIFAIGAYFELATFWGSIAGYFSPDPRISRSEESCKAAFAALNAHNEEIFDTLEKHTKLLIDQGHILGTFAAIITGLICIYTWKHFSRVAAGLFFVSALAGTARLFWQHAHVTFVSNFTARPKLPTDLLPEHLDAVVAMNSASVAVILRMLHLAEAQCVFAYVLPFLAVLLWFFVVALLTKGLVAFTKRQRVATLMFLPAPITTLVGDNLIGQTFISIFFVLLSVTVAIIFFAPESKFRAPAIQFTAFTGAVTSCFIFFKHWVPESSVVRFAKRYIEFDPEYDFLDEAFPQIAEAITRVSRFYAKVIDYIVVPAGIVADTCFVVIAEFHGAIRENQLLTVIMYTILCETIIKVCELTRKDLKGTRFRTRREKFVNYVLYLPVAFVKIYFEPRGWNGSTAEKLQVLEADEAKLAAKTGIGKSTAEAKKTAPTPQASAAVPGKTAIEPAPAAVVTKATKLSSFFFSVLTLEDHYARAAFDAGLTISPGRLPALAEVLLFLLICANLGAVADLLDNATSKRRLAKLSWHFISWSMVLVTYLIYMQMFPLTQTTTLFGGYFGHSMEIVVFKFLVMFSATYILDASIVYMNQHSRNLLEYATMIAFTSLFLMILVSSNHLISTFLAIVGFSLGLYVLILYDSNLFKAREAGLKYYFLSTLSSGLMLYGNELVYMVAGTGNYDDLQLLLSGVKVTPLFTAVVGLIFAGFCFKLGAFPGHLWAADVFQGAPGPVVAFLMLPVKLGVAASFSRLFTVALEPIAGDWLYLLSLIVIASILWGAFAGVQEKKTRRLLAYASTNQMGFILMGLTTDSDDGYHAFVLYLVVYTFTTLAFLAIFLAARRADGRELTYISDFRALSAKEWVFGWSIATVLFSMAGIPPLAGFFSKFSVLIHSFEKDLLIQVAVGLATSMLSVFYYLRILKTVMFEPQIAAMPVFSNLNTRRRSQLVGLEVVLWLFTLLLPFVFYVTYGIAQQHGSILANAGN